MPQSKKEFPDAAMPWVVFTDPQVAGVGLTNREATQGTAVKTSVVPLDHLPRALGAGDTRALIELVADLGPHGLPGGQILASEGADSFQRLVVALKDVMTAKDLGETIFPCFTAVEALKIAAGGCGKDIATLSCCAG